MNSVMRLNSFTGVAYGEKASMVIPTGPVYEEIFLETNLSPEQIKRVSITLNGDEIIVLDGKLMKSLEAYKGMPSIDGFYHIPLADITAKTKNGMRYTALVTEAGDNIILEVEIAPDASGSAPGVVLKGHATVSPAQGVRIVVPQIKKQTMQATSTENEFLDLVSGPLLLVRRMHFLSETVNSLEIHRDYIKVYDTTRAVETMRAKRNRRFWQSGMYHFDPIMRGYFIDELFQTAHTNELKFTVKTDSAVGSIPIIVESVKIVRPDLIK
ncbi:major capsid protein P2 [Vibrio rhizosphaerae]|uniref:Major capsid protein P2 n=1 Tax=Vibrio rhizosphaerae TaxID=398736 RepID=A0ABU4IRL5_9VIBR|nr:major capsid protein P2 [Vibrio rhizosphaerae]MDW6092041.1 major capsid protein P2 [Vibrio rhizosphaerae]